MMNTLQFWHTIANVPALFKVLMYLAYDSHCTISVQSPDVRSGLFGDCSQETIVSYDSDGYDGSVELTPPTPVKYTK